MNKKIARLAKKFYAYISRSVSKEDMNKRITPFSALRICSLKQVFQTLFTP